MSGGTSAIARAQSMTRGMSSWCGTTSVTSPMRSAVAASITWPVMDIRRARAPPTTSGSRAVMPARGRIPTLACVSAKMARSDAIRKSQPSASSSPPVNVAPLTAPMTGLAIQPTWAMQSAVPARWKYASPSRAASLRSMPAQNAGSAPVSTSTRTSSLGRRGGQRRVQRRRQLGAQRVARLGPVQRQHPDAVGVFLQQDVGHMRPLNSSVGGLAS